ncbi:hypothetical protein Tco_1117311 [Tanacetum coccineum]
MSTPVFVNQRVYPGQRRSNLRVPIPLPKDPMRPLGIAYLDETKLSSDAFVDTMINETLNIAHMVVRVHTMRCIGILPVFVEVAAMSESAFCKRFRSSYESSPSLSPPDLPSRKRYRGTSELVEDSEEDDDEEDEEIEEKDEGPTTKDEDPAAGDEGLAAGVEGPSMDDESHGLDDESHVEDSEEDDNEEDEEIEDSMDSDSVSRDREDEGPTAEDEDPAAKDEGVTTGVEGPGVDDEGYGLDSTHLPHGQTRRTGGLISDHAVRLEELSPALFERYDRDIGELFTRSGAVREEIFSQRYRFRSLEYEQERVAVTFGAIWRPVLALEAWAENRDLRLQLAEERRARLELAEVVDGMRRGQEPRGAQFCPCVSALRLVARGRADTHTFIRWWRAMYLVYSVSLKCIRADRFYHLLGDIVGRFWNGLPRMGRAEMVDQARFAWGFLSVFGNANSDRFVITSRTGSYPDTRLRQ